MAMLTVDGVALPDPASLEWSLQDVSDSEAGRTQDGKMHKNRVVQKRKLQVSYPAVTPDVASDILKAINPEYVDVTYYDAMDAKYETKKFYLGDRTCPCLFWIENNAFTGEKKYWASVKFDFIEQ